MFELFHTSDLIMMQFAFYFLLAINLLIILLVLSFQKVKSIRFLVLGNISYLLMHLSVLINIQLSIASGLFVALFNFAALIFYLITIFDITEMKIPIKKFMIYFIFHVFVIVVLFFSINKFSILRAVTLSFSVVVMIDIMLYLIRTKTKQKFDINIIVLFSLFLIYNGASIVINLYISTFETTIESINVFIVVFTFSTLIFVIWINFSILFTSYNILSDNYKYMSYHDELTKIHNRRYIYEHIETNLLLAKRKQIFFSLISIDIDRFKEINDQFGHSIGDKYLVELANLLKTTFRDSDIVARVGGDEFLIIAHLKSKSELDKVLNRLEENKNNHQFTPKNIAVSFSIGTLVIDKDILELSTTEILSKLDAELYISKSKITG